MQNQLNWFTQKLQNNQNMWIVLRDGKAILYFDWENADKAAENYQSHHHPTCMNDFVLVSFLSACYCCWQTMLKSLEKDRIFIDKVKFKLNNEKKKNKQTTHCKTRSKDNTNDSTKTVNTIIKYVNVQLN